MQNRKYFAFTILVLTLIFAGCRGTEAPPKKALSPLDFANQPKEVTVQHILIAFQGSHPSATRSQEEARKLAYEILEKANAGEDFESLAKKYSTDYKRDGRGLAYTMTNMLQPKEEGKYKRKDMAGSFGNTSFVLDIDEIGIADYSPSGSPFGWHIIKRIK